jgi:hypothetical protein
MFSRFFSAKRGVSRRCFCILWSVFAVVLGAVAQAPLEVGGVTPNTWNYDLVTLTVSNLAGYSYEARLDGSRVPVAVPLAVTNMDYHELVVWRTNLADKTVTNRLVRFVVCATARKGTEEGIPQWVPRPVIPSATAEFAGASLRVLAPLNYPTNLDIPVVAWVESADGHAVRVNGSLSGAGLPSFRILRGVGSGLLPSGLPAGPLLYDPQVGGLQTPKTINLETSTTWSNVGGTLSGSVVWPAGSRINVTNWLNIPAGASLEIGAGTVVRLAYLADITNNGTITVNGTADEPVVFSPASRAQPWGGFLLNSATSVVTARNALFTGSGGRGCWYNRPEFGCSTSNPGSHRIEQALFHCATGSSVTLSNCAAMSLFGQFGHSLGAFTMNCTRLLIQGVTSGGQYAPGGGIRMTDCALIEVPVISDSFEDSDKDGIYLESGGNAFTNCLVGFTKDDCIDSGGGNAGTNYFIRCWLEAPAHECIAGSGDGKVNFLRDTVAIHASQGFETGYSAVTNFADHCLVTDTLSGSRFADNYAGGYVYTGFMRTTNSLLLYNYRNIYGMCWKDWSYHTNQMDARGNFLSSPDPIWPANPVWDPATDGWRLAAFMSTPPGAAVGIGFSVWTNGFDLPALLRGVPVALSCFTTNAVSVDYVFTNLNGLLGGGTLTFAPGETVKRLFPTGFDVSAQSLVQVVLKDPANGELTGETAVTFSGAAPVPQVACLMGGPQGDLARIGEGVAVSLSAPSSETVTVDYSLESAAGAVTSGTLAFPPGQTLAWISLAGINPQAYDLLRVTLSNPAWAQMGSPGTYYLVKTVPVVIPPPVTLLAKGSTWKYLDTGTNLGSAWTVANPGGWTGTNFNDGYWAAGPAPLGFGQIDTGPGPTTTNRSGFTNYYFRQAFVVTNAAIIQSLTFNLQRDDGAVVYLNGPEVYRDGMAPGPVTFQTFATNTVSGADEAAFHRTDVPVSALAQPLREGTNVLAVEIHQVTAGSSDIVLDLELIGNPGPASGSAPQIYWGRFDVTNLVMAWTEPTSVLEQTNRLPSVPGGGWSSVTNVSPAIRSLEGPQNFFRLR